MKTYTMRRRAFWKTAEDLKRDVERTAKAATGRGSASSGSGSGGGQGSGPGTTSGTA